MKSIILITIALMFLGCTKSIFKNVDTTGDTVSLEETADGVIITSSSGDTALVKNGTQGLQGSQGPRGMEGEQGDPGIAGPQGSMGSQGATGRTGPKGDDGKAASILKVYKFSETWECYKLERDLYIGQEGNVIDVYNNPDCDHSGEDNKAYCNDVEEKGSNEVCWVTLDTDQHKFTVQGKQSKMKVFHEKFEARINTLNSVDEDEESEDEDE